MINGSLICRQFITGSVAQQAKLRKASKLTFAELHPGTNIQNVPLALVVCHETTIAAVKSYFLQRKDVADFFYFNKLVVDYH